MDRFDLRHRELAIEAENAYRRARIVVYDTLLPGEAIDLDRLASHQRYALAKLDAAEDELSAYRRSLHDRHPVSL